MRMTRRDQSQRLARMRDAERDHTSYLQKQRDASPALKVDSGSAMSLGLVAIAAIAGGVAAGWTAGRTGTTGIGNVQIPLGLTVGVGVGALAVTGVLPKSVALPAAAFGIGAAVASATLWGAGKGSLSRANAGAAPVGIVAGAPPFAPAPAAIGYRPPAPPVPAHMLPLPRVQGTLTESELQAMAHALPIR